MVYREITPRVRSLAVDVFGNYVVQKVNFYSYSIHLTSIMHQSVNNDQILEYGPQSLN